MVPHVSGFTVTLSVVTEAPVSDQVTVLMKCLKLYQVKNRATIDF